MRRRAKKKPSDTEINNRIREAIGYPPYRGQLKFFRSQLRDGHLLVVIHNKDDTYDAGLFDGLDVNDLIK